MDPREGLLTVARRRKKTSTEEEGRELTVEDIDEPGFEAREGDKLFVMYGGAKIALSGSYSSVELPAFSYTRELRAGDDPKEEADRLLAFLKGRTEAHGRQKAQWFADLLNAAKKRANR